MLGTGRPFVIEVEEPRRRRVDTDRLQADINAFADGAVEVEGLRLATYDMVERVKEHDAAKRYRAEVAFDADVDADALAAAVEELEGTTVEQYTPNRVDHRRAASITRERATCTRRPPNSTTPATRSWRFTAKVGSTSKS